LTIQIVPMTPIFITYILFLAALIFYGSLTFFSRTSKKNKEKLFLHLGQEGTANNLTFCSQEILQNKVIGIDGIHRKIMILEKVKHKYNCSIISLDEVHNCELVTNSGSLHAGNLKRISKERAPGAIELQFEFNNQAQPASIIFYDALINSKRELVLLKAKAEYWRVMFSKMLTKQVSVRA
jgi:hypothetical protein